MKKVLLILCGLVYANVINAQDVITKRDGDEIQAKVLDITDTEVKYKKWSNLDGPSYTAKKSDIFMIKYQNGDKDVFDAKTEEKQNDETDEEMSVIVQTDNQFNQEAQARFNEVSHDYLGKDAGKEAKYALWIFGVTPNSIIADENIEISFKVGCFNYKTASNWYDTINEEFHNTYMGVTWGANCATPVMQAVVKNKSSKTIYIDLGNSFTRRCETSTAYYVPEATTQSTSHGTGVGVNLGGILIGGQSTRGYSRTTLSQRVIAIPPKSSKVLPPQLVAGPNNEKETHIDSDGVIKMTSMKYSKTRHIMTQIKNLKRGEYLQYTPEHHKFRFGNVIAYSFSEQCESLVLLDVNLYIKGVIGVDTDNGDKMEKVLPGIRNKLVYLSEVYTTKSTWADFPRP